MLLALCAGHWPLPHFVAAKVCSIAPWCCCCGGCKPSTKLQSHMSCGDGSQDAALPCLTSPEVNRRTDRTDSLRGGRMSTHATRRRGASSIPRQDGISINEQVRLGALLVFRRCIVPSHRHIVGETDSHAEEAWDWVGLLSNVYARQQNPVWSKNPKRLLPQCSLCHGLGQGAWIVSTGRCGCPRWVGGGGCLRGGIDLEFGANRHGQSSFKATAQCWLPLTSSASTLTRSS